MKVTRFRCISFERNLASSVDKGMEVYKPIKHHIENPDRMRQGFSFANEPNKIILCIFVFLKK